MASHAFITTWLMAPGTSNFGVDWNAGVQVWAQKGVFEGDAYASAGDFTVAGCSNHSIAWNPCGEEEMGGAGNYDGPDVFIFWRHATSMQVMGGFLDHWTLDRPRRRDFNNIKEGWHMDPKKIYAQAGAVRVGLQGRNGHKISFWYSIR